MSRAEEIKKQLQNPVAETANGGPKNLKKSRNNGNNSPSDDDDIRKAVSSVIVVERPNVRWEDIAGLDLAKEVLQETVILPIRCPQMFAPNKRQPWKGILLYGPPGTGKSYLAKAVATEAKSTFFSVSPAQLMSKWQGDTEKMVRTLFEMAREQKPSVIFIDEVDAFCSARGEGDTESSRRVKNQFLTELDGVGNSMDGVLLLGATNLPWNLDIAMRRRFERKIYISLPDVKGRIEMFKTALSKITNNLTDAQIKELAKMSEGLSGADVSVALRDALMEPVRLVLKATHFKPLQGGVNNIGMRNGNDDVAVCNNGAEIDENSAKWVPCSPGDPLARETSWTKLNGENLIEPDVSYRHFEQAIRRARPTVATSDLHQYVKWTADFGQDS